MCELHLVVLYIYDQNTTIQMFVVVFWSFILLCVVLQLYWAMMCVNACICTVSSMHTFLLSMTKHFPVQFILNPGHTEYELGVLMMGNTPNPNAVQTMTPVLQAEITYH